MYQADIIIIGSGLGGLEVALAMAQEGKKVLVLERQVQPGGCMQSYRRGAMHLDTGLHYVGGLSESSALYESFNKYGLMSLPWKQMDTECFEEIHIAGKSYCWPQGIDNFINAMKTYFPHETDGLDKYAKLLYCTDELWMQQTNAWDYLNSIISDKTLIQVLTAPALCKMELRKESLPLFTFVHGTAPFIENSWRLATDGNAIVERLVEQIRELGGEVLTGKEVVSLEEEGGIVTKAHCLDGSEYSAKWFVSNAHPAVTCSLVKDSKVMKNIFRRRMQSQPNTHGMFTLHLQLHNNALEYFNHNKIVLPEEECWDVAVGSDLKVKAIMISARIPEDGSKVTNVDILTPMLWDCVSEYTDSTLFHRPELYMKLKEEIAAQCLDIAESVIPDLRSMVVKSWSSSPLTYRDYNLTPEGSAFGFRKDFSNPMSTIISPKTQIPNLLMTGQSLMLHGLHGVTMTAAYTCNEINKNTIN
ncbi:MAG: NAD(P)/FAD-dependent oxidoreductase [Bacteroidaceae bacterium]|nr:NAD(P)/FAD-dependent oxidoreductase [Bacteroidaceae bacterium]